MIIRYGIANVTPEQVAKAGQDSGLSGSVSSGLGFGSWGIEPTTFVEFGSVMELATSFDDSIYVSRVVTDSFIVGLLKQYNEQSAYRVLDNVASLIDRNGVITLL